MSHFGTESERLALQDRVHRVYGKWAPDHADGEFLTVRDYEPGNPNQQVDCARIAPEFNPDIGKRLSMLAMGEVGYKALSDGFNQYSVAERGLYEARNGRSTLISTLHLRNVLDTPITHQNLLDGMDFGEELAQFNDVLASPMLSRIDIFGFESMKVMAGNGSVDIALPKEGARKYGMLAEDISLLDRFYSANLNKRLRQGVVVHWSLPTTRGLKIITEQRQHARAVNRVADEIANIIRAKGMLAVPVPMFVEPGNTNSEVLPPRKIKSVDDVHRMMTEMTEVATDLAGMPVYYGVPEGAQIVKSFDATE